MNFSPIKSKVITFEDYKEKIGNCGAICYGRFDVANPTAIYNRLNNEKHYSVFRHDTIYYSLYLEIVPPEYKKQFDLLFPDNNPYVEKRTILKYDRIKVFIAINRNYLIDTYNDNVNLYYWLKEYVVNEKYIIERCPDIVRITTMTSMSIAISRELNRVSPNNITERSTRYVIVGEAIKPYWYDDINEDIKQIYNKGIDDAFNAYQTLIDKGCSRQQARGVLPLDAKTICIYTYSLSKWKEIFKLRIDGISGKPHPDAVNTCKVIKQTINNYLKENYGVYYF